MGKQHTYSWCILQWVVPWDGQAAYLQFMYLTMSGTMGWASSIQFMLTTLITSHSSCCRATSLQTNLTSNSKQKNQPLVTRCPASLQQSCTCCVVLLGNVSHSTQRLLQAPAADAQKGGTQSIVTYSAASTFQEFFTRVNLTTLLAQSPCFEKQVSSVWGLQHGPGQK